MKDGYQRETCTRQSFTNNVLCEHFVSFVAVVVVIVVVVTVVVVLLLLLLP